MHKSGKERRSEKRYRVNKPGSLRCLVTNSQVDVEIHDMSASGALLSTASSTAHMCEVELHIHPEDLHVPASIKWRAGDRLGVSTDNSNAKLKGKE